MGSDDVISPIKMRCLRCQEEFSDGTQICPHDGNRLIVALPDPLIGKTFAERYEILEVLGRGGMSVVYKAKQKFIQNFVAIKVLNPNLVFDPSSFERFKQEAVAAIAIRDKNVIQVLDFGISDEKAFLIMEYLEGMDLADWLQKHGEMPVDRTIKIFLQACDGLAAAHSKGVVHRDLKPGNLFMISAADGSDLIKIVDFGIAKIQPSDGAASQNLTQPGEVFGSPLYMSPEQCQGKVADTRSDIYSLGCVLYETLTGVPPLMGINSFETMNKHVGEKPLSVRGMDPDKDIPELLDECVMRALSKNPNDRQQSMTDLKKELIESVRGTRYFVGPAAENYLAQVASEAAAASASATSGTANQNSGAAGPATTASAQGTGAGTESTTNGAEKTNYKDNLSDTTVIPTLAKVSELATQLQDTKSDPELHKLVAEAVDLTQKQEAHNRQLRKMVAALFTVLGVLIVGGSIFATMPGPPSDPAPFYKREGYLWKITEGENDLREGKYKEGMHAYQAAYDMSKDFGDGNDKKTKALYGLMLCMMRGGANPDMLVSTRKDLLSANLKHMEYIYKHDGHDLMNIIDLDAGLLSRVGGHNLDKPFAEQLARSYVENAKREFDQKNYLKAISWLEEALEVEEETHSSIGVSETASKFAGDKDAHEHIEQIEEILKRAREAEREVEHHRA
ncbi:MAG TPA: serine/threonine-protein kinase [Drouetiella sp.]